MSRMNREGRKKTQVQWPVMSEALTAHFGERFWMHYASAIAARTALAEELDHTVQKQLLREWWDWNATAGAVDDPRTAIAHLGVELPFEMAIEARQFMNAIYEEVITRVRAKAPGWKP